MVEQSNIDQLKAQDPLLCNANALLNNRIWLSCLYPKLPQENLAEAFSRVIFDGSIGRTNRVDRIKLPNYGMGIEVLGPKLFDICDVSKTGITDS